MFITIGAGVFVVNYRIFTENPLHTPPLDEPLGFPICIHSFNTSVLNNEELFKYGIF